MDLNRELPPDEEETLKKHVKDLLKEGAVIKRREAHKNRQALMAENHTEDKGNQQRDQGPGNDARRTNGSPIDIRSKHTHSGPHSVGGRNP